MSYIIECGKNEFGKMEYISDMNFKGYYITTDITKAKIFEDESYKKLCFLQGWKMVKLDKK